MRNFLLEKSCKKCGEETIPFLKNQNYEYLWIKTMKFHTVCFYFMSKSSTTKTY